MWLDVAPLFVDENEGALLYTVYDIVKYCWVIQKRGQTYRNVWT